MEHLKQCENEILAFGATDVAHNKVSEMQFNSELSKKCNKKTCKFYGKKWTCPPNVEDTNILIEELKGYNHVIIFRKVYSLESITKEKATKLFYKMVNKIMHSLVMTNPPAKLLVTGGCHICEVCSGENNTPCRFPSIAYGALEAHGISLSELSRLSGLYLPTNEEKRIAFFGAVFLW